MTKVELAPGEVFAIYSRGLIYMSVCTNIKDRDRIHTIANQEEPTGVAHDWDFSTDPCFKGGEPNPSPCDKDSDNLHYLMVC